MNREVKGEEVKLIIMMLLLSSCGVDMNEEVHYLVEKHYETKVCFDTIGSPNKRTCINHIKVDK